jgi:hypothetical protein
MVVGRRLDYWHVSKESLLLFAERPLTTSSNLTWLLEASFPLNLEIWAKLQIYKSNTIKLNRSQHKNGLKMATDIESADVEPADVELLEYQQQVKMGPTFSLDYVTVIIPRMT